MMRVVFDTNVLVSYLLAHRLPIATLMDVHLAQGRFVLVSAVELQRELMRVLGYARLQRYYDATTRARFVALITALSELVELPETIPPISRDPDDDLIIACAVVGHADVIVSGDKDLLDLGKIRDISILTAAQFLVHLGGSELCSN